MHQFPLEQVQVAPAWPACSLCGLLEMTTHRTHTYVDRNALERTLNGDEMTALASRAEAVLVQVYSALPDKDRLRDICRCIARYLPEAVVVGATTVGEIVDGRLCTQSTVLGFTFFDTSRVSVFHRPCAGDEQALGAQLGLDILSEGEAVTAVLLLATPILVDTPALLRGLETTAGDLTLFGGGAGEYGVQRIPLVFAGERFYDRGVVAVVLRGQNLHVACHTYLGWRALSKSMIVTETDGLMVKKVDGAPAFDVYRRYLNIRNDEHFFLNALEFPFLLQRDGEQLARVPVAVTSDGALRFVADVAEGERFRIGYGDMDLIVDGAREIHQGMTSFAPQAVWVYNCRCRRFLMQEYADFETQPYQQLAPTFGFYTNGEFFGHGRYAMLNSTMVAVGLREGPARPMPEQPLPLNFPHRKAAFKDPYANKHVRVIASLLRFIDTVTLELEASRRELLKNSMTDPLTQLANRVHLDEVLDESLNLAHRYEVPFAVMIVDVDNFKDVNDTYGHLVGDRVLAHLARLLQVSIRNVDTVGRWGGEEFMVIAPHAGLGAARRLAEKLRQAVAEEAFPEVGCITASFGVTCFVVGDDMDAMLDRADFALYSAKRAGRNRVEVRRKNTPPGLSVLTR